MKGKIIAVIVLLAIIVGIWFWVKKDRKIETAKETDFVFSQTEEYKYLMNNKDSITSITIVYLTEGGRQEYDATDKIEDVYNAIKDIVVESETDEISIDNDSIYTFQFADETEIELYFNNKNLEYNGKRYKIKNFKMINQNEIERNFI